MRRSGLLVHNILNALGEMVAEGVSTWELELAAVKMMEAAGAKPAFKNYFVQAAGERYRFVLCTSVNEEIVHGMPNPKRILKKGDIVSSDTGVSARWVLWRFGYYGRCRRAERAGRKGC